MPLWTTKQGPNDEPKSLRRYAFRVGDKGNVWAAKEGWLYQQPTTNGAPELLVGITSLDSRLGNSSITQIDFPMIQLTYGATGTSPFTGNNNTVGSLQNASTSNVIISFDQIIWKTGANTPTLGLSVGNGVNATAITASYASGNGTNRIRFSFTVSGNGHGTGANGANADANVGNSAYIFIANGSSITLNGAVLTDNTNGGVPGAGNVANVLIDTSVSFAIPNILIV